MRESVITAIQAEKLIAILRRPEKETLLPAVRALVKGGLRLIEITFDRSGKWTKEDTCSAISALRNEFGETLFVGAGTVLTEEEVTLAHSAGAQFIVSPDCDPKVVAKTKSLGMVSIPAAFTPTEIALALKSGADFIKLFPAGELSDGYLKMVKAPLSDAKLLAVGGVTKENAAKFISLGFDGVGVGGALYDERLVKARDWEGLFAQAKTFIDSLTRRIV